MAEILTRIHTFRLNKCSYSTKNRRWGSSICWCGWGTRVTDSSVSRYYSSYFRIKFSVKTILNGNMTFILILIF